jgi:DNA-directed RNA polymerase subunit F
MDKKPTLIDEALAALEKSNNAAEQLLKEKQTLLKYIETLEQLNKYYKEKAVIQE